MKEDSNESKQEDGKNEWEQYRITVDFLKFEATSLWQIFNSFFIGNNIFVVVISTQFKDGHNNHILFLILGFVGLLASILWLQTFKRNSDWYAHRMQQAKDAERLYVKVTKDEKWHLLNKEAEKFAEGRKIRGWKNNNSGIAMIIIFMALYIVLMAWAIFKLACKC